jgi:hypothetical protein
MRTLILALLTLGACVEVPQQEWVQSQRVQKEPEADLVQAGCLETIAEDLYKVILGIGVGYEDTITDIRFANVEMNFEQAALAIQRLGYTVEVDFTPFPEHIDAAGLRVQRPITADFLIVQDTVACMADGEGPFQCGVETVVSVVPKHNHMLDMLRCPRK